MMRSYQTTVEGRNGHGFPKGLGYRLGYPSVVKLIQCIIQPYKLDVVVEALRAVAPGLTVFEAKGHGRQKGHPILYRGVEYSATLLPKLMIEVVANDNRVDDIVRVVVNAAG